MASLGFDWVWFRAWFLYASLIGLGCFRPALFWLVLGVGRLDFLGLFRFDFRLHSFRGCCGFVYGLAFEGRFVWAWFRVWLLNFRVCLGLV